MSCQRCGSEEPKGACGVCGFWIGPTYPGAKRERSPEELEEEREDEHCRIMERASTSMPRFFKT